MTTFIYKAIGADGELVEAVKDADNELLLVQSLQQDGLMLVSIAPAKSRPLYWLLPNRKAATLPQKDIGLFTRELATLLASGLPLDRSLTVLMDLTEDNEKLQRMIGDVLVQVKSGTSLAQALDSQTNVFSGFYLNMIRAGEMGGSLETVLSRLSVYLDDSKELKDTVTTALIYPAFLMLMSVASLLGLLTFVIPQFITMFENAGKELPLSTQFVIAVAAWLQSYWWVLFIMAFGCYSYFKYQFADSERRLIWDGRLLKIPIVGNIILSMETANFTRTLGTLLANGVNILTGLSIVQGTVGNQVLAGVLTKAEDSLKQGKSMASALIESDKFPLLVVQLIKMGEETGKLEEMLMRAAVIYDKQLRVTINRMLALLEPAVIVTLGFLIGGIIYSVLSAILSVNDLAI
jgi:general secretion pathway protein F